MKELRDKIVSGAKSLDDFRKSINPEKVQPVKDALAEQGKRQMLHEVAPAGPSKERAKLRLKAANDKHAEASRAATVPTGGYD